MLRRSFVVAFSVSVVLWLSTTALWLRSYTNGFWIQTSPPGTVYAFKVWDSEASVYRLTSTAPYPNRRAAIGEFSLNHVGAISGLIAIGCGIYLIRRRRKDPGCCPTCGYDLRASPERCPECGRPIETNGPALEREKNRVSMSAARWHIRRWSVFVARAPRPCVRKV